MSSTNRGAVRSENDYYRTPEWAVALILPHLAARGPIDLIVDPGCGDGAIAAGVRAAGWETPIVGFEVNPSLAEAARETGLYLDVIEGNYVHGWARTELSPRRGLFDFDRQRMLVIGNPPYGDGLDLAFVKSSLHLAGTGEVAMLLKQSFAASKKRKAFHDAHPSDMGVLPRRPSFCASFTCCCGAKWSLPAETKPKETECPRIDEDGPHKWTKTATDSCDYAWFCHGPGPRGRWWVL